jgi:anti-sigma factor RsiW
MNRECKHFDAYLVGELPVEQAAGFERHLLHCDDCRELIEQQRWIDGLLQSPERLQVERAPAKLIDRARKTISQRGRVRIAACGLAAAATIFVALGWLALYRGAVDRSDSDALPVDIAEAASPRAAAPRATYVGGADVIAVPIESHHADVTIVRIYSTYVPPYGAQTAAYQPAAAGASSLPDYSNGG